MLLLLFNDAGYYYPYDGEYTVDGKSLYFIYGMLQTSDSDEILTDYRMIIFMLIIIKVKL